MTKRRRSKGGALWRALGLLLVLGALGTAPLGYLLISYPETEGPGRGRVVVIDVPWGAGARAVAARAAESGAVRGELRFAAYLRLSGMASRIKAGRHRVRDNWSPERLARALTERGLSDQVRVTIREGWTRFDIAAELDRLGVTPRQRLLDATADPVLLADLEIEGESAEGYLFPETYLMEPGTGAAAVVRRLVATFHRRVDPLMRGDSATLDELARIAAQPALAAASGPAAPDAAAPDADTQPAEPRLSGRHVAVILASMVESETALERERPLVAAVMLNRLRSPEFPSRLLQIDPTVAYGCRAEPERAPSCRVGTSPLLTRHLEDPANRYNTYLHPGLPPGPIGNPSLSAIEAVLSPAEVGYFYFVADGEGGHVFSVTRAEHNAAVSRYRARRDGRAIDAGGASTADAGSF